MLISDILRQIRTILSQQKDLAKRVPLIVKAKSHNEQARFENLLHYCLDQQTLQYLEQHHDIWLRYPELFDDKLKSSQQFFYPQGTRAVSAYLDTEHDNI